jgi:hypothetical protein
VDAFIYRSQGGGGANLDEGKWIGLLLGGLNRWYIAEPVMGILWALGGTITYEISKNSHI